jgi:hypothetical protein
MGGWGKGIAALNLLQLGKAYNGRSRMNTQTEALITRRETTPFDRYDVTPLIFLKKLIAPLSSHLFLHTAPLIFSLPPFHK